MLKPRAKLQETRNPKQWPDAEPANTPPLPDLSGGPGFSLERAYGALSEINREKWGALLETWLGSPVRRVRPKTPN
jgi:hypothetical protein